MWFAVAAALAGPTYDIGEDVVEGELVRPEGSWIGVRRPRGPRRAVRLEEEALARWTRAVEQEAAGGDGTSERDRATALRREALEVRRSGAGPVTAEDHVGLAWLLEDLELREEALAAWRAVLVADPSGPWAPTARLSLAEAAFARGDLADARAGYAAVLPDPTLGRYAAYKLAWCEWNLGDFGAAGRRFASLGPGDDRLSLEARTDLARVAAQLPDDELPTLLRQACAGEASCMDDLRRRANAARADAGLPPLP
jgi:hypothetical protein